jgi:hypothetical protein
MPSYAPPQVEYPLPWLLHACQQVQQVQQVQKVLALARGPGVLDGLPGLPGTGYRAVKAQHQPPVVDRKQTARTGAVDTRIFERTCL